MNIKRSLAFVMACLALSSCASIDFSEASPNIDAYNPKSVAILPFTNSIGIEAANETCNSLLAAELVKRGYFGRIAEPGQVKAQMLSNQYMISAITRYRSEWVATGTSNAALANWICRSLRVESIMFGEISNWGTQSSGLDKYYRVGLNLRWVEYSKGEILWKASHTMEKKSGMFSAMLSNGQKDTAEVVINMIMDAFPKKR